MGPSVMLDAAALVVLSPPCKGMPSRNLT